MRDMEPSCSSYAVAFLLFVVGLFLLKLGWFYAGGAIFCAGGAGVCLLLYMDQVYHNRRRSWICDED